MKLKGFGWVVVLAIALGFAACQQEPKSAQQEPIPQQVVDQRDEDLKLGIPEVVAGKITLSPGIERNWFGLVRLGQKMGEDFAELKKNFDSEKPDYVKMAEYLVSRQGVIHGKNFKPIGDPKGMVKFWSDEHAAEVTLEFNVVKAYVSNAGGPHPKLPFDGEKDLTIPPGQKPYNAYASITAEIHLIAKKPGGELLHNTTYMMDFILCHLWDCAWEPCGPGI